MSENEEIEKATDVVLEATEGRGVLVIKGGGDRRKLLEPLVQQDRDFVIRMRGDRHVVHRRNEQAVQAVAARCRPRYRMTVVREQGANEMVYGLRFGDTTVRLPSSLLRHR